MDHLLRLASPGACSPRLHTIEPERTDDLQNQNWRLGLMEDEDHSAALESSDFRHHCWIERERWRAPRQHGESKIDSLVSLVGNYLSACSLNFRQPARSTLHREFKKIMNKRDFPLVFDTNEVRIWFDPIELASSSSIWTSWPLERSGGWACRACTGPRASRGETTCCLAKKHNAVIGREPSSGESNLWIENGGRRTVLCVLPVQAGVRH